MFVFLKKQTIINKNKRFIYKSFRFENMMIINFSLAAIFFFYTIWWDFVNESLLRWIQINKLFLMRICLLQWVLMRIAAKIYWWRVLCRVSKCEMWFKKCDSNLFFVWNCLKRFVFVIMLDHFIVNFFDRLISFLMNDACSFSIIE